MKEDDDGLLERLGFRIFFIEPPQGKKKKPMWTITDIVFLFVPTIFRNVDFIFFVDHYIK